MTEATSAPVQRFSQSTGLSKRALLSGDGRRCEVLVTVRRPSIDPDIGSRSVVNGGWDR
jgi:hypothetical protein